MTAGPFEAAAAAVGRAADEEVARLQAIIDAPPAPQPPPRLLTGASTAVPVPGYTSVPWARTYLGANQTPSTYTADAGTARAVKAATIGVWLSFKEAPGPWLESLVQSITAQGLQVIVTHNHEPENDGKTPAEVVAYHARWDATLAVCADLAGVRTATILMGSRKVTEWETFWHPGVDLCGFDRYNVGIQSATSYVPPDKLFTSLVAFAAAKARPLAIGETGTNVVGTNVAGRTQWAADVRAYLADAGVPVACWWNQGKCVLDVPTADAWLAA